MTVDLAFEVTVQLPYDRALELVEGALKAEGFGVLTRIDVRAVLKEKLGADFRPYSILGACNPVLAHRALGHSAEVGLLLPCNVTVEAGLTGGSIVRIGNPEAMLAAVMAGGDQVLRDVGHEARARLERVAAALKADSGTNKAQFTANVR